MNEEDDQALIALSNYSRRKRSALCVRLLDAVKDDVSTFRPSQSLAMLAQSEGLRRKSRNSLYNLQASSHNLNREKDHSTPPPKAEIDIVISGGGLKAYYMNGCNHILQHELKKQNIQIARIAGASGGAWAGLFMLCQMSTQDWLDTYYAIQEKPHMTIHEVYAEIWPWVNSKLPENAWQICSGRLFISITEVTWYGGFQNHMISEFTSNFDLFEACLASSAIPYITMPTMVRKYRNMSVVDGGITNNTPIFTDYKRRQLVFRLGDVLYPIKTWLKPQDQVIEALVVRGAIQTARFLQGEPSDSFSWVYSEKDWLPESDEEEDDTHGNGNGSNSPHGEDEPVDYYKVSTRKRSKWWRKVGWYSVGVLAGYGYLARYHPTFLAAYQSFLWQSCQRIPGVSGLQRSMSEGLKMLGQRLIMLGTLALNSSLSLVSSTSPAASTSNSSSSNNP